MVDGPFSLFQQTTKYGLAFSQLLPLLEGCERYTLVAEIRWGEQRAPLEFRWEGGGTEKTSTHEPALPEDLAVFVEKFRRAETDWEVRSAATILEAPGLGLVIPDLEFQRRSDRARVYLESLGYFRKESVWKRVDLARRGLGEKIVFALSERLRVDESVIGDEVPAALYVYKGVMNAKSVLEKIEALATKQAPSITNPGSPRPR